MKQLVLLGLGANTPGHWGAPRETLVRACQELDRLGVRVTQASALYLTPPFGPGAQNFYENCVISVDTGRNPEALLKLVKGIERAAGRRSGRRWSPRPLDIDIVDFKGRVANLPGRLAAGSDGRLVLPHRSIVERAFVLLPLRDIAPAWRHPANRLSAGQMLKRLQGDCADIKLIAKDWRFAR